MIQDDPKDWQVLERGSLSQRLAYDVIRASNVFSLLAEFDPAHISTFANDIAVEGSDIDIICCALDLPHFESVLINSFGSCPGFYARRREVPGASAVVGKLPGRIAIEVYAESKPVAHQMGYRHYKIACRLLTCGGEPLRERVRELKSGGMKTEPAFAHILGLEGDPYQILLQLDHESDLYLRQLVHARLSNT